ncbi:MAG: OmpA family protein [Thermodesulfobacteriota bacterium]
MKIIIIILVGFAIVAFNATSYSGVDDKQDDGLSRTAVYFKPGTFELAKQNIEELISGLSKTKRYQIYGYTGEEDKGTEEELLSMAAHRANVVRDILIQNGFSQSRLTTMPYNKGKECKAVLVEMGE